ncbi:MAG: hypothetical protein L3J07_02375 [Candidatus Magasanikbacteria bacterium]|nr:hypothetical protein [Candidatus Magasanikbacteria bacterium]
MNREESVYSWENDYNISSQNLIAQNKSGKIISLLVVCNNEYGKYFLIRFVQPNIDKEVWKKIQTGMQKYCVESNEEISFIFSTYENGKQKSLELANKILQSAGFVLEEKLKVQKEFKTLYNTCSNISPETFENFLKKIYFWKILTPTIYTACQKNGAQLLFICQNNSGYWRVSLNIKYLEILLQKNYTELLELISNLFENSPISTLFPVFQIQMNYLYKEWNIGPFEDPEKGLKQIQNVFDKVLHKLGFILYPHK